MAQKNEHCGDPKKHTPHWHGKNNESWCNGRYSTNG
jgi:hypothetical protein